MSNVVTLNVEALVPKFELRHRLTRSLEHAGMTPEDMAQQLGLTAATIRNYMGGRTHPQVPTIREWADITHVPRDWLLNGIEPGRDEGPDPDGVGADDECVPRGSNPDPSGSQIIYLTSHNAANLVAA